MQLQQLSVFASAGSDCKQPYSSALLNISAMSYGALSDNAILALSTGAKLGGCETCHSVLVVYVVHSVV